MKPHEWEPDKFVDPRPWTRTVQSYAAPTREQIMDLLYLANVPHCRITVETWTKR